MTATLSENLTQAGIRSRHVDGVNGLRMHILEAGDPGRPCLLLLHGFPELSFSWRKIMPGLAQAGYHVIAPDQRGYGRTTGWDPGYDGELTPFRMLNLVRDCVALLAAMEIPATRAVIGHDFGSPVAAYCALARPDLFPAVALMSAPFEGPPSFAPPATAGQPDIHQALAGLPRPRKHYQWYYSTRPANSDMAECQQGLPAFLRAYYHVKSADWAGNDPQPLAGWTAEELARMPTYYIMDEDADMAETVAPFMPGAEEIAACSWLTDEELAVYAENFATTGFQGGLQWYRCMTDPVHAAELKLFSGRSIDVPACYITGARDWGIYQRPGAIETMLAGACSRMMGFHVVEGAGHWVQQEQPGAVTGHLLAFLAEAQAG